MQPWPKDILRRLLLQCALLGLLQALAAVPLAAVLKLTAVVLKLTAAVDQITAAAAHLRLGRYLAALP